VSHLGSKVKGSLTVGRGNTYGELPVGTDGQVLLADSAEASGMRWATPSSITGVSAGLAGLWIYGDGSDGNVTLVANTTLAAGDLTKNYNNLTLAGFTLTFDQAADNYMVIYVKDTLLGGGGTLSARSRGAVFPPFFTFDNAGGAGGAGGGTAGSGGVGGDASGAIYVFARKIGGTTIDVRGSDGVDGTDGTVAGFAAGAGSFGTVGTNGNVALIAGFFPVGGGAGAPNGIGGAAAAIPTPNDITRTLKDIMRMVMLSRISDQSFSTPYFDARLAYSTPGSGGGGGNADTLLTPVDGGSGAGGRCGIRGDGGTGGNAAALATGSGNKASGGGGGSGAGGSLAMLVCDEVLSATSVLGDGGAGGDGGDGAADGAGVAIGGGGGGGGGGGAVYAIVTTGSGFLTLSVTAGAGGAGGVSAGSATPGDPGVAGAAGYSSLLLKT